MSASMQLRRAALVVSTLCAASTSAAPTTLERGDACTLKAPLAMTIYGKAGTIKSTLEAGARVEIIGVSDGTNARVRAGEVKGDVATVDLESACKGTLRACRLTSPVTMYEHNRSDSKSWRIKVGATLSVLKKGSTWGAVRVGDLRGFVKTVELDLSCVLDAESDPNHGEQSDTGSEAVERGEGPGVLFLPFTLEAAAPAANADALLAALFDRGAAYRPDAVRFFVDPEKSDARSESWKVQIAQSAQRARGAGMEFVIVGRLEMEKPTTEAPLVERHLLQLAAVEAQTGKVLKAVRIRPSLRREDAWANKALAALLATIPAAPGSTLPERAPSLDMAPVSPRATTSSGPTRTGPRG